jgi:hypothetical protein
MQHTKRRKLTNGSEDDEKRVANNGLYAELMDFIRSTQQLEEFTPSNSYGNYIPVISY